MAIFKVSRESYNANIGAYPVSSHLFSSTSGASDLIIPDKQVAFQIRSIEGGWIVYHQPYTNEDCIEFLQIGERSLLIFDKIYSISTTVDGKETTAGQQIIYYLVAPYLYGKQYQ